MLKRLLLLTLMLLSLVPILSAQQEDTVRVWSFIDTVDASWTEIESEDGAMMLALQLTINGIHSDACEYDVMTDLLQFENNLDVQAYRDIPIAATCLREDTPFETSITLDIPLSEMPPYLIINDQVWSVTLPEGDDISTDDVPEFEELMLVGSGIENVNATYVEADADGNDAYYALELSGSHGVGCDVPSVYSVRELAETTLIGVFDVVPEMAICPALLRLLDASVEIPATFIPQDALVTVNEYIIDELENQAMSESNKVMTNINSVNVNVMESMPMQISLEVSGEHPDGCDYPVIVDQSRNGNTVNVEIYREVPMDVMCPMMLNPYDATIQLDGNFESGSYTINVNGTTVNIDL